MDSYMKCHQQGAPLPPFQACAWHWDLWDGPLWWFAPEGAMHARCALSTAYWAHSHTQMDLNRSPSLKNFFDSPLI